MRYKQKQNKAQRRAEAVTRKEARDNRTTEQQLALISNRPGNSYREVFRLGGLKSLQYRDGGSR